MLELYFAPGACSFVPHVALEAAKAKFEPKLVKLHKGEQKAPEYLKLNPNGQVPVLVVDAKPLTQIVAICEYLDRAFPEAGLLPTDPWKRAQALSQLAWMNNTVHPTFTHFFRPENFAASDAGRADIKSQAVEQFRKHLERIQDWIAAASPYWHGARISVHDAYAFVFLRWSGFMGIDPKSLPRYLAYIERVVQAPPVAAVLARERIALDTYKG
ncbi:MAG TPA: glutathione S-transferase family protein [Burkholderiales bacterium]